MTEVPYGHPARIKLELTDKENALLKQRRASTEGVDAWFASEACRLTTASMTRTELREIIQRRS